MNALLATFNQAHSGGLNSPASQPIASVFIGSTGTPATTPSIATDRASGPKAAPSRGGRAGTREGFVQDPHSDRARPVVLVEAAAGRQPLLRDRVEMEWKRRKACWSRRSGAVVSRSTMPTPSRGCQRCRRVRKAGRGIAGPGGTRSSPRLVPECFGRNELGHAGLVRRVRAQMRGLRVSAPSPQKAPKRRDYANASRVFRQHP
jgi:hypothetical protein